MLRLTAGALAVLALASGPGAASSAQPAHTLLHVGDSLAYGTALYLDGFLRGWRIDEAVSTSLQSRDVAPLVARWRAGAHEVLVVSAGTNGSPADLTGFVRDVRSVLRAAGSGRCVIWANVVRPPYRGVSYDRLNAALAELDRRYASLVVFDWASLVHDHPAWLAADGVHVRTDAYRERARRLATLARVCG